MGTDTREGSSGWEEALVGGVEVPRDGHREEGQALESGQMAGGTGGRASY